MSGPGARSEIRGLDYAKARESYSYTGGKSSRIRRFRITEPRERGPI
jgi:hypothetical protein